MAGYARLDVAGNLGRDAELTHTANGSPKLTFSVAHSPRVQQGQQERTDWFRCTFIGKRAEAVAQYLTKGQFVHVRGDFEARPWQGRDGVQQISLDVFVTELDLPPAGKREGQQQAPAFGAEDPDSVPF